ncbi:unnamed protein product [Parajaminaea phylloscopi]
MSIRDSQSAEGDADCHDFKADGSLVRADGTVKGTHYEVLGLPTSASKAEIRARYLKLVRMHHPDKTLSASGSSRGGQDLIHAIYAAHSELADDNRRALYDAQLARDRILGTHAYPGGASADVTQARVSAVVDLDAFEQCTGGDSQRNNSDGDGDDTFQHPCRCGSSYLVTSSQLVDDGIDLVECQGCSEVIRVVWRDEDGCQTREGVDEQG